MPRRRQKHKGKKRLRGWHRRSFTPLATIYADLRNEWLRRRTTARR